ncbi:hypothetical protein L208DRAFT_1306051, partial [Tricholoma matsutake]
ILTIGKGILRVFSLDFPLLGASPIPIICSIILTSDFPLLEAEVALIKKLKRFKDHGRTAGQIRDIKKMVIEHCNETYKGEDSEALPPAPAPRRGKVSFNLCCQILDLLYFLFRPSVKGKASTT